MEKKIILTVPEFFELISKSYEDGFLYCIEKDEVFKKNGDSQGRDVISYTNMIVKGCLE